MGNTNRIRLTSRACGGVPSLLLYISDCKSSNLEAKAVTIFAKSAIVITGPNGCNGGGGGALPGIGMTGFSAISKAMSG